jgi:hypothetical protein
MATRNSEMLESFVAYCHAYPQLRFWQALLNWSGYKFIFVASERPVHVNGSLVWREHEVHDPYNWEVNRKP